MPSKFLLVQFRSSHLQGPLKAEKFPRRGQRKKQARKIAPLSLSTLSVPCMKIQGGTARHCPPAADAHAYLPILFWFDEVLMRSDIPKRRCSRLWTLKNYDLYAAVSLLWQGSCSNIIEGLNLVDFHLSDKIVHLLQTVFVALFCMFSAQLSSRDIYCT